MSNKNPDHYFLRGGGAMGELIRAKDWSKTPLGDPATWPQSLCTMVAIMLDNPFGMYIAWGSEYTQLYNDGYRPILGATKHPQALGIGTRETFSEIWHIIESMFDGVMNGKAVGFPDFMLPLNRNGFVEECYFDFSYSPIRKDDGTVGGVLVTVIETTEKKRATEALKESNARYINNIMQAPVAMCILRGSNLVVEIANEQMLAIWGKQAEQVMNKPVFEGLPEAKNQGLEPLLENVYATGERFVANERPVNLPRNGKLETTYLNFVYEALKEADGTISGIAAIAFEVTPQVIARSKVEESEQKVRALVENAPFPIAVYVGKELIVELANQSIIDIWGKGNEVIGRSFKEVLPELDNQLVFEQIEKVIATGEAFHTKNTPLDLVMDGKLQTFYFNYSLTPLYDITGNIYGVMNTGVDLTELNIAKKQIEDSEQNIRSMVLQSPIGICVIDADTLVSEIVNDSFIEIAGKAYEEIAGKHYWDTFAEARIYYEDALNKVIEEGESFYANEVEMMLIRHGREEIIYVTFVYAPLKNTEGKVKKVAVWVLDNTPQVAARQKIEEADKRFRNTMKQAPVGITILRGPQYIVEMANDAYLRLIDRKEPDFVGNPLFASLPEVEEAVHSLLDSVLNTGVPYHGNEVPIPVNRYGKQDVFYFDFLYHPLKEEDGKISGVIVAVTEVTEKVEARKKVEESKRLYETIMQSTPDLVYVFDLSYRFSYANEALLKMWGRTWNDSAGKGLLEVGYEPWHAEMHEREIDEVIATKKPVRGEVSFPHATLGKRIYDYILVPVIDHNGNVEAIAGTTRDITQQVEARKQIEESEMRFRNMVEQAPVAISVLRGEHYIVEVANERQLQLWDKAKEEVLNKPVFTAIPEGTGQGFEQLLNDVFSTGKPFFAHEFPTMLTRNGQKEVFYTNFIYKPLYDSEHTIGGVISVATDVTEQVIARKKVEESEERFRSLAQTLPQLVWVTDAKGNAEFASSRWKEYSGIEPAGEKEWKEMVHPGDYDSITASWMNSLATGSIYSFDVRLKSKDGEYRWHAVKGGPVLDNENKIIKWVGAFTDIQDQKVREEKKDEFIGIASHEMKTPLTIAKAYLQMLELMLDESNGDAGLYAKKASQAVSRLNELISELLDVSKIRLGKLNYTVTTFNFNEMIDSTVENIQLTSTTHAIIKTGKVDDDVTGDKDRLQQVVINLLTNAIKYSPGAEKVFIHLAQENDRITVSVKDTGIGIAQQSLNKIFEKYHRVEEHAVHFQGLGIGLFISYEIIQRHYGQLWAESEPGKGSTFYFAIPVSSNVPL